MAYQSALFQEKDPSGAGLNFSDLGGLAKFLSPVNSGGIDVVYEYPWTLTPSDGRTETPFAVLTEFRLLQSAFLTSARYFATGIVQQGIDTGSAYLPRMRGYAGLFDFKNPTGFWYQFPYFSDVSNEVQSSWTSLDFLEKIKGAISSLSPTLGEAVGKLGDIYQFKQELTYPRVGVMDRPKLWESSTPRSINIKFPLFNTVKTDDIKRNWDLCYLLLYQNMFNKRDFITAIPPVFYTVFIPGQFFSLAMYVSDLKIYNRGNMRRIDVGGIMRNVPDVYEIDMSLTDMIMPSQNMLAELLNESPVEIFSQEEGDRINPTSIKADEAFQGVVNAVSTVAQKGQETIQTTVSLLGEAGEKAFSSINSFLGGNQ